MTTFRKRATLTAAATAALGLGLTGFASAGSAAYGHTSAETTTPASRTAPVCTNAMTDLSVAPAPRPVNHQLITLTNTGERSCTVLIHPTVSFGPDLDGTARGLTDGSHPTRFTVGPGDSVYAGLQTSPADQQDDGRPHAQYIAVDLVKSVNDDGSTTDFGKPRSLAVDDLFIYEPTVTPWQPTVEDALG
ncbi:DUF4232 domain-containing protein [Streptomyces triticagri]|uniref:DUF4232 domain-containing protein n=1 Tax=Streptomyces triticagri TaxID=2293568 RepID=A0A372M842_9ACTN|nr:DUF4232 domain-containing protein [Streptomyces triticagri]RFU87108.1 DUF4232 domain-containing protein [Streptomyces triticagri]